MNILSQWLSSESGRRRLYLSVAGLSLLLGVGFAAMKASVKHQPFDMVVSDGRGYYVYLPSLFVDGDLDFSNQMRQNWGPDFNPEHLQARTPLSLVRNKYPIGFALTLTPGFALAHGGTCLLVPEGANGYSIPYQLATLITILVLGWLTFVLIDRLLTQRFGFSGPVATVSVLTYWLGSHFSYYYLREPFMVHVVSTFWCTLSIWLMVDLTQSPENPRLPMRKLALLGLSLGMAVVCRPSNLFLMPFVVYFLGALFASTARRQWVRRVLWLLTGLVPLIAQMAVWKAMNGHWIYYSYEGEGFAWGDPALSQTLLSSRHGLFFWSPILLVACLSLVLGTVSRWREPVLFCCLLAFGILWYFNSCWHCWWFGDAFGGRAFLELSFFFVLGLAFFFQATGRLSPKTRLAVCVGVISLTLIYNYGLMFLYVTHRIPRDEALLALR